MAWFSTIATNIEDETKVLKVKDIVNKNKGLTAREKEFIFFYVRNGDKPKEKAKHNPHEIVIHETAEEYKMNILMILDSFFQYRYLPRMNQILNSDSSFSESF